VLQLRRAKKPGGVRITAGVQFTNPTKDQQKPYVVTVTEPVTPGHRAKIEAVIAHAISNRLNLVDDADVESWMQAALAAADMPGLGLTLGHAREYPTWRPTGRGGPIGAYPARQPEKSLGYLDFLGIDRHNGLHVVETKVGGDGMLVMQALDYLIWVTAQAASIREDRAWPAPETEGKVHIDLVLAPKGNAPALGPYTAGQLEALAGDVSWRVFLVDDPLAQIPKVKELPRRAIHDPQQERVAKPVQPPRFVGRVQRQLRDAPP
jgi:hypothetical protein